MTDSENDTPLDELIEPTETPHPDRHEHAKTPHPIDDDELAERTRHERDLAARDDQG